MITKNDLDLKMIHLMYILHLKNLLHFKLVKFSGFKMSIYFKYNNVII